MKASANSEINTHSQWDRLTSELDEWQRAGKTADFWWRDDDACEASQALSRLLEIANAHEAPVALATIPAKLQPSLQEATAHNQLVTIFQHGFAHINHSGPDEKGAWELGMHRGKKVIIDELTQGQEILAEAFPVQFEPVMVPPWNRLAEALIEELPKAGFIGASGFGMITQAQATSTLKIVHCHCDPISWKRGKTYAGTTRIMDQLIAQLVHARTQVGNATTGYLTHHLDMDDEAWMFTERLFDMINSHPAASLISPKAVFCT